MGVDERVLAYLQDGLELFVWFKRQVFCSKKVMEIYLRNLVQMYQLSVLYVSSDVKINVLEGGVSDALFAEMELVFDGEKYDVLKLQVGV